MQTVWKGSISFGLVSIPVRLVGATEERDVSFRQVRRSDGSRIRYKRVAEADGEEVAYADIAKGWELPDGDVVVLTDDDLADLPVSTSKVVDVVAFVPMSDIDPTALARAYYAEPSGDAKPYVLLRDALEASGRVAVVKVALRNKERLAALRPRDGVLVLQTMLWPDEVRRPDFRFLDDDVSVRAQEMRMAESFIEAMSGDFDPAQFHDDYRAALEDVVAAKVAGHEVTHAPAATPAEGKVVDLMEALRRSVAEAKKARGESAPPTDEPERAPARRAPRARKVPAPRQPAAKAAAKAAGEPTQATARTSPAEEAAAKPAAAKEPAKTASRRRSA